MKTLLKITRKKWIIITAAMFISVLIIKNLLDTRPFRFENFDNSKQLQEALTVNFPIGYDAGEALSILEKSGAACENIAWKEALPKEIRGYHRVYQCTYSTGWISLYPLHQYKITIFTNKESKVIYLSAHHYNLPN